MEKKELGQFYTTNYEYILQGFNIPNVLHFIEPFAGQGDLVEFIKKNNNASIIECYDIDPKKDYIVKRDTIKNPPIYANKYLITNSPYLARNKSNDKTLFDKYDVNDLYKCLIKELLTNVCIGGVLIVPLNFWSSIRKEDINLRKHFLQIYDIILINIFEEQVFNDTSYTVCSFQFEFKKNVDAPLNMVLFPSKVTICTELNDKNNYIIGGDIYNLKSDEYKITRATKKNKDKLNTNILVKCIDDNKNNRIGLSYIENKDKYIDNTDNQSARAYALLIIEPAINECQQKNLIIKFNILLENYREKYHSLFLTNYRESNDIARKRISFDLVYSIVGYILENEMNIAIPALYQTKEWRKSQPWYKNGKSNQCEKFQIELIERTIKTKLIKTNERLNIKTLEMNDSIRNLSADDAYDWTENFDGKLVVENRIHYFNLKFVVGTGGAQTRTNRETYHFIQCQLEYLLKGDSNNIRFINILDGDFSYVNMNKFNFLKNQEKYESVKKNVFIGSLYDFQIKI